VFCEGRYDDKVIEPTIVEVIEKRNEKEKVATQRKEWFVNKERRKSKANITLILARKSRRQNIKKISGKTK